MFAKVGDSAITKIMSVENGTRKGELVVKCKKCGQPNEACTCKPIEKDTKDEQPAGKD